uniref:Uncharacterized protein n=1 Tax=Romanomermis culicivorax TaxID=13658 RepID=A0A915IB51_ROMCU
MKLEDKETILANRKNLAKWSKSLKPLIIVAPDLTKQQQARQKNENRRKKEKKILHKLFVYFCPMIEKKSKGRPLSNGLFEFCNNRQSATVADSCDLIGDGR